MKRHTSEEMKNLEKTVKTKIGGRFVRMYVLPSGKAEFVFRDDVWRSASRHVRASAKSLGFAEVGSADLQGLSVMEFA